MEWQQVQIRQLHFLIEMTHNGTEEKSWETGIFLPPTPLMGAFWAQQRFRNANVQDKFQYKNTWSQYVQTSSLVAAWYSGVCETSFILKFFFELGNEIHFYMLVARISGKVAKCPII